MLTWIAEASERRGMDFIFRYFTKVESEDEDWVRLRCEAVWGPALIQTRRFRSAPQRAPRWRHRKTAHRFDSSWRRRRDQRDPAGIALICRVVLMMIVWSNDSALDWAPPSTQNGLSRCDAALLGRTVIRDWWKAVTKGHAVSQQRSTIGVNIQSRSGSWIGVPSYRRRATVTRWIMLLSSVLSLKSNDAESTEGWSRVSDKCPGRVLGINRCEMSRASRRWIVERRPLVIWWPGFVLLVLVISESQCRLNQRDLMHGKKTIPQQEIPRRKPKQTRPWFHCWIDHFFQGSHLFYFSN